ncbi:PASTA domain-containing protein [Luedemannella helvata]
MTSAERSRRRSAVLPAALVLVGVFAAGSAAGWWAAGRYHPRYAPDIVVTGSDAPAAGDTTELLTPDVRGLTEAAARQVLADAGLAAVKVRTRSEPAVAPQGTVVTQEPAAGAPIGGEVTLALAAPAVVPRVVGADVRAAVRDLRELGATVEVRRVYRAGAPIDSVLASDPAEGALAAPHVVLTVAAPPATAYLADLPAANSGCGGAAVTVDGVRYERALRCPSDVDILYLLDRRALRLDAVVGQPDTDGAGRAIRFRVIADGREIADGTLRAGQTRALSLDTSGVVRLAIVVDAESGPPGGSLVFGDGRLTAGPEAIAALRAVGG